jgi:hypothetical protein
MVAGQCKEKLNVSARSRKIWDAQPLQNLQKSFIVCPTKEAKTNASSG